MSTCVEVKELGSEEELAGLFRIPTGASLGDVIGHVFNQTLQRDLFYGAWADVWDDDGQYGVKITSPQGDVSAYSDVIPPFLAAAKKGLAKYKELGITDPGLSFLAPMGLSMVRRKSVQLLHYPPTEAMTYSDYLYSPTNRRWESLLGYNGCDGSQYSLLETIVDAVPIAAPGGDASKITPHNKDFEPYGKQMLQALLSGQSGKPTPPVVGYGGPVRGWIEEAFSGKVPTDLKTLSLVSLPLVPGQPDTPVLCANHPSEFFYFKENTPEKNAEIMKQDLIAAGWQVEMSKDWGADAAGVLKSVTDSWDSRSDDVAEIVKQQELEFGWSH